MPEFTEYSPGTPCWIDLQTSDVAGGAEFYRALFGWDHQELGSEFGGYGFFLKGGKMVAGIGPRMADQAPVAWTNYVCVRDAGETAGRARNSSGSVLVEPMEVGAAGRMSVIADPTGAVIGIWQPGDHKGAQVATEDGAWGWSECRTRDVARASRFYSEVFGWTSSKFAGMDYLIFENDGRGIAGCVAIADQVPAEVPPHWLAYFGVKSVDAAVATAEGAGGTVVTPAMDIPGIGRLGFVADPQGAIFGLGEQPQQSG